MSDTQDRWRAKRGDRYWYVSDFDLRPTEDLEYSTEVDETRWLCRNYFDTKRAAAKAARLMRAAIQGTGDGPS